jgi:hypothetical protein
MPARQSDAAVVLWIDSSLSMPDRRAPGKATGSTTAERVLGLLGSRELPATWTVADFESGRPFLERLAGSADHDIAVCPALSASSSSLDVQAKPLSKLVAAASREGFQVTTLVVAGTLTSEIATSAKRLGIQAARTEQPAPPIESSWRRWLPKFGRRPQVRAPRPSTPLCHGLWEMPAGVRVLSADASSRRTIDAVRRQIDRAISQREACHAVLDLNHCERLAKRDWRRLESLLDEIAAWRAAPGLRVLNSTQLAASYAAATRGMPARSILRQRAA